MASKIVVATTRRKTLARPLVAAGLTTVCPAVNKLSLSSLSDLLAAMRSSSNMIFFVSAPQSYCYKGPVLPVGQNENFLNRTKLQILILGRRLFFTKIEPFF
jgi:hypothetical protein